MDIKIEQSSFLVIIKRTSWSQNHCSNHRNIKKWEGIYTRMLCAVLNKSWKQWLSKQQLYNNFPHTSQTIQVRWARYAGHCEIETISLLMFSYVLRYLDAPELMLWTSKESGRKTQTRVYVEQNILTKV